MKGYKKPSKFNFVTLTIVLVLLAVAYVAVQFIPPYWRKYRVKEILANAAAKVYPRRRNPSDELLERVRDKTIRQMREVGIDDDGLEVEFQIYPSQVTVVATYRELINHPLVNKTTTLNFRPHNAAKGGLLTKQ